jgi:hypothetical protein
MFGENDLIVGMSLQMAGYEVTWKRNNRRLIIVVVNVTIMKKTTHRLFLSGLHFWNLRLAHDSDCINHRVHHPPRSIVPSLESQK